MVLRRIALAPLFLLADWIDHNPVSALGVVLTLGALAVLFVSVATANGVEVGGLAVDATTAGIFAETALERPAYLAAALVGIAVVLFYDG